MAQQRSNRGFASMDPEAQRAIARKGGRAAHESGHAHEWTPEEAAKAGHRGGLAAHHRGRGAAHRDTAARRKPGTGQEASENAEIKHEERQQFAANEEQAPPESERERSEAEQETENEEESSRPSRGRAPHRHGDMDNG